MPEADVFDYVLRHPTMQVFLLEDDMKTAWVSQALAPKLEMLVEGKRANTILPSTQASKPTK